MMSHESSHRSSPAWQKGMALAAMVYQITKAFPSDERFGLTNQLRRASVSIPSNIAEGKGRVGSGDFLQFLSIARGSALEVHTQLELALTLEFGNPEEIEEAMALTDEVCRILTASIRTLRQQRETRRKS